MHLLVGVLLAYGAANRFEVLFGRFETVSFREKVKRLGDRTQKMVCYSRLRRRHYGYLEKTTLSLKQIVSMKRNAAHLVFSLLIVTLGGCASPRLSTIAIDRAEPQQGWEGVNNLFQDNLFYFGGQPDEAAFKRLAEEAGITTVVNLRQPQELERLDFDEPALVEELGLRYVNIPITPDAFSTEDVDRFAEVLAETKGPVLLHCGSSNRAGGMWATYLARHRGFALEEAISRGRRAGLNRDPMIEAVRRVAEEEP